MVAMKNLFCCPVCAGALYAQGHSLVCAKHHTFDLAASGYVSLLTGGKAGDVTGDNKEMCAARSRFLSGNPYACLATALGDTIKGHACALPSPLLVDAACGEGYYTAAMAQALASVCAAPRIAGVDLSKAGLKHAANLCKEAQFAVASIFALPLPCACADVVTDIFAPVADAEFLRILRPGGLMLLVGPGERHLWGLKAFLYDHPYENERKQNGYAGFTQVDRLCVETVLHLTTQQDIFDLFTMTPYFWKTPRDAVQRLRALTMLDTPAVFDIRVFQKTV